MRSALSIYSDHAEYFLAHVILKNKSVYFSKLDWKITFW